MRIRDAQRGDGPEITPKFHRGDSWLPVDGEHVKCGARQIVLGAGVRQDSAQGLLLRCGGCLMSYVLVLSD